MFDILWKDHQKPGFYLQFCARGQVTERSQDSSSPSLQIRVWPSCCLTESCLLCLCLCFLPVTKIKWGGIIPPRKTLYSSYGRMHWGKDPGLWDGTMGIQHSSSGSRTSDWNLWASVSGDPRAFTEWFLGSREMIKSLTGPYLLNISSPSCGGNRRRWRSQDWGPSSKDESLELSNFLFSLFSCLHFCKQKWGY